MADVTGNDTHTLPGKCRYCLGHERCDKHSWFMEVCHFTMNELNLSITFHLICSDIAFYWSSQLETPLVEKHKICLQLMQCYHEKATTATAMFFSWPTPQRVHVRRHMWFVRDNRTRGTLWTMPEVVGSPGMGVPLWVFEVRWGKVRYRESVHSSGGNVCGLAQEFTNKVGIACTQWCYWRPAKGYTV